MSLLKRVSEAVIKGNHVASVEATKAALAEGIVAKSILDEGLICGMGVIGERFEKQDRVYIPEVLIAARAFKLAMEILEPELVKDGIEPVGHCLIGSVEGDLHDIGKNLVAMMLKGVGFEVVDLGLNVPPEKFVRHVENHEIQIVGLSALLTRTMETMETTIQALKAANVAAKIMVGGAPLTQKLADKLGADAYAPSAKTAAEEAMKLLEQ